MDDVYDLFKRGTELLEAGDFNQATVPLSRAAALEPDKASIREALGRAYFRSRQFDRAREEFQAVVDHRAHERLRAVLPRARPARARKARGRTQATRSGGPAAAPAEGLPDLPRTGRKAAWDRP